MMVNNYFIYFVYIHFKQLIVIKQIYLIKNDKFEIQLLYDT